MTPTAAGTQPKLQAILNDPSQKKAAAKKLSARIREINRLAKSATGATRRRYYDLKAKLAHFGITTFGFRVISRESDATGNEIVVVKLADSMIHVPAAALPDPKVINLRRIPFRRTLGISRAIKPVLAGVNQPAF
ncbi:MAG TPA: hypothetical protein PLL77_16080 [Pyrinomonadaceae bacterium]|nr:hypothetical protein [Pyrinomonadaceae bacterium]